MINLCIYQYKSTFSKISAVIEIEIDNVNKFAYLTTANCRAWL